MSTLLQETQSDDGLLSDSHQTNAVGHPIHVVQCDKPTLEEITQVQQKYIDELMWYVSVSEIYVRFASD